MFCTFFVTIVTFKTGAEHSCFTEEGTKKIMVSTEEDRAHHAQSLVFAFATHLSRSAHMYHSFPFFLQGYKKDIEKLNEENAGIKDRFRFNFDFEGGVNHF